MRFIFFLILLSFLFPDEKALRVAAFNIQTFGMKKISSAEGIQNLPKILNQFDLIAVQELRDTKGKSPLILLELLEKHSGENWGLQTGPFAGRSQSKEASMFLWRKSRVKSCGDFAAYPDGGDRFEREPWFGRFSTGTIDFVYCSLHLKPADVKNELDALESAAQWAFLQWTNEDDFIFAGDFNADGKYWNEKSEHPLRNSDWVWAIGDEMDTTTASNTHTYDRIIFRKEYTKENWNGISGVYDFAEELALDFVTARKVSDHRPVYLELVPGKNDFTGCAK